MEASPGMTRGRDPSSYFPENAHFGSLEILVFRVLERADRLIFIHYWDFLQSTANHQSLCASLLRDSVGVRDRSSSNLLAFANASPEV